MNLSFNVRAIVANYATAEIHMKVEAACGTFMDRKSARFADMEIAKNMPSIIASMTDRKNNKIIALMSA